jgi:WD40 repeat protein
MNHKIVLTFIIFCCSNVLSSMELHNIYHPHQPQNWRLYKTINVAEKIVGTSAKDILRKTDEYYISSVCIDPAEKSLAIASCDRTVHIIDIESEEIIMPIKFDNDIASICFDRDGKQLAVLSYKPTTYIFNIKRDENKKIIPHPSFSCFDHNTEISSLFFDNSNNAVGVILDDLNRTMNIINITQNKKIYSFEYNEWIKLGRVSPSKKYFATATGTKQARLFDLQKGVPTCVFTLQGLVTAFAFDKREQFLAIASNEPKLHIFDLTTFQEIASFPHKKYISTVCFSASGKTLVFGAYDGTVYIFKKR